MRLFAFIAVAAFLFTSCKKNICPCLIDKFHHGDCSENNQPQTVNLTASNDVTANFHDGHPQSAAENGNALHELAIYVWTNQGAYVEGKGYVSFDLTGIPTGATISSAKLYLYGVSSSGWVPQGNFGENKFTVQRVLSSWNQTTLTWNNVPASTNTNEVSYTPDAGVWNVNAVISVTELVKDMIRENKPYGFSLSMPVKSPYRSVVFGTSEVADAAKRPKLEVTYQ